MSLLEEVELQREEDEEGEETITYKRLSWLRDLTQLMLYFYRCVQGMWAPGGVSYLYLLH